MTGVIDDLWKYPFKGARGHRPEFLNIDPAVGVAEDRRYAIRRIAGDMREWAPKTSFFVCMNTALMAAQEPVFVGLGINQLDARYLQGLAQQLGVTGELQVQDTEGVYNLCDTKGAYVSFLNLASVQALSKFVGQEIAPSRFRMNIWMKGLEPFEELTWVDKFPGTKEILVGDCRFRVDDACERCRAIKANPETGQYDFKDLESLSEMMRQRGYRSPHRSGVFSLRPLIKASLNARMQFGLHSTAHIVEWVIESGGEQRRCHLAMSQNHQQPYMSELGHFRRFTRVPEWSGVPQEPDVLATI